MGNQDNGQSKKEDNKGVIYSIPCKCGRYKGETGCKIWVRVAEHQEVGAEAQAIE